MPIDIATRKEYERKFAQIVAKAWIDSAFKQRLLRNSTTAVRQQGIRLPAGKELKIFENTSDVEYLPLLPIDQASILAEMAANEVDERAKRYAEFVIDVAKDQRLKQELLANPTRVVQEQGLLVPKGKQVNVVELEEGQVPFVLPPRPALGMFDLIPLSLLDDSTPHEVSRMTAGTTALVVWGTAAGTGCLIVAAVLA
jgi:hypothetical protein